MASSRDKDKKDFLISMRKKVASGLTAAPVWVMQKANKRIWNPKGKRHWTQTDFGDQFRKVSKTRGQEDNIKSGGKPKKFKTKIEPKKSR